MAWSPEISQLSTDVTQLTNEVNAQKNLLSGAVTSAQSSRITANTGAAVAESSVVPSTTNMLAANTHKNSVLSIYGTQAAQQSSIMNAAGQAATAAASAVTATAGLTQDLSGVTAQALHRSPNAITSMFIYDTSKDSDGGAWTEKCQHTSWYNEALMGKWLGPHASEFSARNSNPTVGPELVVNGNFETGTTGWSGLGGVLSYDAANKRAALAVSYFDQGITTPLTTVNGRSYRVSVTITNGSTASRTFVFGFSTGYGGILSNGETILPGATRTLEFVLVSGGVNTFTIRAANAFTPTAGEVHYFDNISVREVTALTTVSNDYFQLATDGKFYRLWKNLFGTTDVLTNTSIWVRNNVDVAAQGGLNSVIKIIPNTSNTTHKWGYNLTTENTDTIFSIEAKADGYSRIALNEAVQSGNFSATINLTDGTGGNASTVVTPLGDGWYRVSWLYRVNNANKGFYVVVIPDAGVVNPNSSTWTPNGTSGILVRNPQLEYGPIATSYELKTVSSTGLSEVFRGNKRDFPRLAGIVAEGANVNIYDLTEPNRPMWMRFTSGTSATFNHLVRGAITTVNAIQGILFIGGTDTTQAYGGQSYINFAADDPYLFSNFTQKGYRTGGIANRNNDLSLVYPSGVATGANNANRAYMITATVLPDAPTDQVTGLRVPTVLLATVAIAAVVRHNGTVVAVYTGECPYAEFTNDYRIRCKRAGTSAFYISSDWRTATVPTSPLTLNGTSAIPNISLNSNNKGFYAKKQSFMYYPGINEVAILQENPGTYAKGFVSRVTNSFNTGWMPGDIRRVYLSDTEAGSVAGPELVVNGTFNSDISGWTVWSGFGTIVWNSANQAVSGSVFGGNRGYQEIPTVIGRTYKVSINRIAALGGPTGNFTNFGTGGVSFGQNILGNLTFFGTATATTTQLQFGLYNDGITSSIIDNISVREVVADRSYKAQAASINGIVTRSQASAGTSLVGYSGFSTTNYLQEPYSSELEFGTGEFSASAWVNIPATLPSSSFPIIGSELVTNGDFSNGSTGWTLQGTVTVSGGVAVINSASSSDRLVTANNVLPAGKFVNVEFDLTVISGGVSCLDTVGGNSFAFTTSGRKSFIAFSSSALAIQFFRTAAVGSFNGTIDNVSVRELSNAIIFDRAHSSGSRLRLALSSLGNLTAEAFDGTTTRTVITTATYNTAQWLKAEVNYTTDGSLAIRVNGREVAVTRGNPLLSLSSRYNSFTNTEEFDNATWSKTSVTVTANAGASPLGDITADRLVTNSGTSASWYVQQIPAGLATTSFISIFAKADTAAHIGFSISTSGIQAAVNLTTGAISLFGLSITSTLQSNGWYRITLSAAADRLRIYASTTAITVANQLVVGDGISGVLIWGAQIVNSTLSALPYQRVGVATDFNFQAPFTIGNSFTANAPFPGSIALLKLGATVPTPEQSVFMYEQEKQLFRPGALSVLPDANAIIDMSYDDATDRWSTVSTTNESYWNGLVRSSVTAVPAGSYSKITATSGVELVATTTTNPGVYVSIPPYALREEIVKRSEAAGKLVRKTVTYDYTGGFTGNITTGSTSIVSVAGLVYPTSYIGARIAGTGIPANTVITGVSGTTIYISAPATATTTTLAITFLDFILPVGMEAKVVLTAGVIKREGSTSDYTRLFDGFIETIRFAVAPGSTAWVQIQATRTAQ